MTPSIKNWLNKPQTLVVGVSAIKKVTSHQDENNYLEDDHKDHHNEHDRHEDNQVGNHSEDDHHHANHIHHGDDPHIWHDPANTILISDLIYKSLESELSNIDSKSRILMKARYKNVKSILSNLDEWNKIVQINLI